MNEIIEQMEKYPLEEKKEEITLLDNIGMEMVDGYKLVKEIVEKINSDTRKEMVKDEEGEIIGHRHHIHPQLLRWVDELRKYQNDLWKLGGGEIQQEAEKKALEVKAKLLIKLISTDPDKRKEMMEQWKSSKSFKE